MIPTDLVEELLDRLAFCIQHGAINERLLEQRDLILKYINYIRSGETIIELAQLNNGMDDLSEFSEQDMEKNNEHKELDSDLQILQENSCSETK